jgi:hypothetical protein
MKKWVCSFVAVLMALTLGRTAEAQAQPAAQDSTVKKLNLIVRAEITIDRPASLVWPELFKMGSWMVDTRVAPVSGTPGEEGEIQRMSAADPKDQGYLIETVRIDPMRQYVLKVAARDSVFFGFGDFTLIEIGGKTRVLYSVFVESNLSGVNEEELQRQREETYRKSNERLAENLRNLKSRVEAK